MRECNIKAVLITKYSVGCLIYPFQDYKRLYKTIDATCIVVQEVEKMLTLQIDASSSMLLYFMV